MFQGEMCFIMFWNAFPSPPLPLLLSIIVGRTVVISGTPGPVGVTRQAISQTNIQQPNGIHMYSDLLSILLTLLLTIARGFSIVTWVLDTLLNVGN